MNVTSVAVNVGVEVGVVARLDRGAAVGCPDELQPASVIPASATNTPALTQW